VLRGPDAVDRRAATVIARLTARRAARSAAVWGALFGALIANEALSYHRNFPTPASRAQFVQTFGHNDALAAVIGPARHVDTLGGFVAWRVFGLLIMVGAVWGLLTGTRQLRGEEDAGRWEVLLTGRTTRRAAAAQGIAGLAAGFAVLWSLTAAGTVAAGSRPSVGFSVAESLYYATAATVGAAMFLALGALVSQVATTRRSANGLGAAVVGTAFLIRLLADSAGGRGWLRWLSPLGWVENLRPLTGAEPLAFVPIAVTTAAAALAAILLAGRRDVAAGILGVDRPASGSLALLGGPVALGLRLERGVVLAWVLGFGVMACVFGVVARAAAGADMVGSSVERAVAVLGGDRGGAAAWMGYELLYVAALVAFAVAGQIAALRADEADGRLEHLLARPVGRARWLAGRVALAAGFVMVSGAAIGVGGWIGVATGPGSVALPAMIEGGVNAAAPALFVLGVGTLLYGVVPRLAVPVLYAFVLWSFVAELVGSSISTSRLVLDTSVLGHLGPVPAADLDWANVGWLAGLGVIATIAGVLLFGRRDLAAS
jgi:polyether ionophore transport system permease protein